MSQTSPHKPRTAIVTGGSRGIGRAIAIALGDAGFNVTVNYARNRDAADEAASLVTDAGGTPDVVQCDISDSGDRARLLAETLDRFGALHLLVNNAGVAPRVRRDMLETTDGDEFDYVLGTNLKGPYLLSVAAANQMLKQVEGGADPMDHAIVNIGSISAYTASTARGEYCLAKAGIAMMTKLFAARLAEARINVYEVRPGIIATDMTGPVKDKYDKLILEEGLTPLQRWGQPEDVAAAVRAVADGRLPFSTGEVINADGGFHLHRL
jgi:NAD(P)-dependent dehydrogenase (short-subunit alcohol dehydrogenase family)